MLDGGDFVSRISGQKKLIVEERKRLARDLHDSVNQKLFSLSLIARGLNHKLTHQDENIRKGIKDIEALAQDALLDLKNLIWQLQPINNEQDFLELLKEYGEKIGLNVTKKCVGEDVELKDKEIETILRIGQEALNNVKKHSQVNKAHILFLVHTNSLSLIIKDEGCGFEPNLNDSKSYSFGINNMKERATQIGGKITIYSSPNNGTVVNLTVPLQKGEVYIDN